MLRINRLDRAYYYDKRNTEWPEYRTDVGYIRAVSKTLCPKIMYKDLQDLLSQMIHVVNSYDKLKDKRRFTDEEYDPNTGSIYYRCVDDMLRSLPQNKYDQLSYFQQSFLYQDKYTTSQWNSKTKSYDPIIYYKYKLKEEYYRFLYVKREPIYNSLWYCRWGTHNSEHAKLQNKIEQNCLGPKISKARSRRYAYRSGWSRLDHEYKMNKEKQLRKAIMKEDIADYYEEKEERAYLLQLGLDFYEEI